MINRLHLEVVDSTNNYATKHKSTLSLPACITADYQEQGRGQNKNSWLSEKDRNILLSWVFEPVDLKAPVSFYISKVISIAVSDFLETYLNNIYIKWPNDILAGHRKIAGILIENTIQGPGVSKSIAGIGVNINQEVFPSFQDRPEPTSLLLETGDNYDRKQLLDDLIEIIKRWNFELDNHNFELIDQNYYNRLFLYEEWGLFRSRAGVFEAKIVEIEKDGQLVLAGRDGKFLRFTFQEITFLSL